MTSQQEKKNMKDQILNRIEVDKVVPTSKMWWQCQECMVWMLWVGTVVVGMIATAVVIFTSVHAGFALYEATHDSLLLFFIDVLPYIWLIIFVLMVGLAYVNIRATKRGYKYPLWQVVGSSLALSLFGGLLLHGIGVGYVVDKYLGEVSTMYYSQEELEQKMWHLPDAGRVIGKFKEQVPQSTTVLFEDVSGAVWRLETADLHDADVQTLYTGNQVRVLGIAADLEALTLHSCGVFPWMFDADVSLQDMQEDRRSFVERMYAHKDNAGAREAALQNEVFGDSAMGQCARMPVIDRISESMR